MKNSITFKEKNIEFIPYLLNKNTIGFTTYSFPEISFKDGDIVLNEDYKGIEIRVNKKRIVIKLDDENFENLLKIKEQEIENFREYYNRLTKGEEEILCYLCDNHYFVKTKTSLDIGYAPYWDRMFRYIIEKNTNGIFKDNGEENFQNFVDSNLSSAISKESFALKENETDKYININLNKFIKYLIN